MIETIKFTIYLSRTENEINSPHQTNAGPEIIQFNGLSHVKNDEGNKHGKRDDLLKNFELWKTESGISHAIGGNLDHVFEKCNPPTDERRIKPVATSKIFQVGIPRERHEDIGKTEEKARFKYYRHE